MRKKLTDIFFKDIRWKLLALGLAIVLWFIGMNVEDPVLNTSSNRTLTLLNEDLLLRNNVVVLNKSQLESQNITVGVSGKRSELNVLEDKKNNIFTSIDLRAVDISLVMQSDKPVTVTVEVDAEVLLPYERTSRLPRSVEVKLDKYVQQVKNIQVYTVGEVREGYEQQEVTSSHKTVTVSGPRSYVEKVSAVRVQVNVQDANGHIGRSERLVAYDEEENDITSEVELSVRDTYVQVSILPYKTVDLEVRVTGIVAQGYALTDSMTFSVKQVDIVAEESVLQTIDRLTLGTININNASDIITQTFDIRQALPSEAVSLRTGQPTEAAVTVPIEKVEVKQFWLPLSAIAVSGISADYFNFVNNAPIPILLRGTEAVMSGMTVERISAQLNLSDLETGEHDVPLNLTLARGVTLAEGTPTVRVRVLKAASNDVDNMDETDENNND